MSLHGARHFQKMTSVCLITPAYNEADNLPVLYERVHGIMGKTGFDWQWIIVDDGSQDNTYPVLCELAQNDPRIGAIRLSRNYGSHLAIRCGLQYANGDCAVILAADLQDPPEIIPGLLSEWRGGARVVWGERGRSPNESRRYRLSAKIYYSLMRRLVGIRKLPPSGADVVLLDADVVRALSQFRETNVSLFVLIAWLGFQQATISYEKGPRMFGKSGWTLTGLVKLMIDSVTAFSYLPIRTITYLGILVAVIGFIYATFIIFAALAGNPPEGWASLMVVVLVLSGFQMLMLGILGEYLWRALDEARSRPPFVLEAATGLLADIVRTKPDPPQKDAKEPSLPASR